MGIILVATVPKTNTPQETWTYMSISIGPDNIFKKILKGTCKKQTKLQTGKLCRHSSVKMDCPAAASLASKETQIR